MGCGCSAAKDTPTVDILAEFTCSPVAADITHNAVVSANARSAARYMDEPPPRRLPAAEAILSSGASSWGTPPTSPSRRVSFTEAPMRSLGYGRRGTDDVPRLADSMLDDDSDDGLTSIVETSDTSKNLQFNLVGNATVD
jgi:hypothetical protein